MVMRGHDDDICTTYQAMKQKLERVPCVPTLRRAKLSSVIGSQMEFRNYMGIILVKTESVGSFRSNVHCLWLCDWFRIPSKYIYNYISYQNSGPKLASTTNGGFVVLDIASQDSMVAMNLRTNI